MKAKISTNFAGIATITAKGTSMKTMACFGSSICRSCRTDSKFNSGTSVCWILKDPRDYAANRNFDIKGVGIDDNGDPYIYRCMVMQEEQLQIQQASSW